MSSYELTFSIRRLKSLERYHITFIYIDKNIFCETIFDAFRSFSLGHILAQVFIEQQKGRKSH